MNDERWTMEGGRMKEEGEVVKKEVRLKKVGVILVSTRSELQHGEFLGLNLHNQNASTTE